MIEPTERTPYIAGSAEHECGRARLGEPLLCRLGFHKWRNYGKKVEVFWEEPDHVKAGIKYGFGTSVGSLKGNIEARSKLVYEERGCAR